MSADIGLIGLAVMGENLVLNMESHGFTVAVYNRNTEKVDKFVNGRGKDKKFVACHSLEDLVKSLKAPRKVMMMIMAGDPVDEMINKLKPLLSKGDIIIDGGNSHFPHTTRRVKDLAASGILFSGTGVSGGEEGALKGPSMMPGGSPEAWPALKPIFQGIAAKVHDSTTGKEEPCCDWVGEEGAGHFVKMVHNGIEYGDMQLICEAYHLMKEVLGMSNEEMGKTFEEWNKTELDSFLIEITRDIMMKKADDDPNTYVVDQILDKAGQKGTGKWTVMSALDCGVPLTMVGEAVFARCLSGLKTDRVIAAKEITGPSPRAEGIDKAKFIEDIRQAVYASKLVSYAQGYLLMRAAAKEYGWNLNYGGIALMWRGGCIIRSAFLGKIKEAYTKNPELTNLLLDPFFKDKVVSCQESWRNVAATAVQRGIPIPSITSALVYFDGYRTARLPANLLQAQRDFFGAHMYQREDKGEEWFHTNWTGHGGDTASSAYNV